MDQEVQQPAGGDDKQPSAQGLQPGYAFYFQIEHEGEGNPALNEYPERDEQRKQRRDSEQRVFRRRHRPVWIGTHSLPLIAGCSVALTFSDAAVDDVRHRCSDRTATLYGRKDTGLNTLLRNKLSTL